MISQFLCSRNKSRPGTVPCLTPDVTCDYCDLTSSQRISCRRSGMKACIQGKILPSVPQIRGLLMRRLCGTVSNALLKSKIRMPTWCRRSWYFSRSCFVSRRWVSQECPWQNPWLASDRIWCSSSPSGFWLESRQVLLLSQDSGFARTYGLQGSDTSELLYHEENENNGQKRAFIQNVISNKGLPVRNALVIFYRSDLYIVIKTKKWNM